MRAARRFDESDASLQAAAFSVVASCLGIDKNAHVPPFREEGCFEPIWCYANTKSVVDK